MKKSVFSILLTVLLLLALPLGACAAGDGFILDQAGLLTQSEISGLQDRAQLLAEEYGIDVVILTVDSIGYDSPREFADDFYDNSGFYRDGVLFLLAMESRDWYLSAAGSVTSLLSDGEMDSIGYEAVPYLSDGDYCGGFHRVIDLLPDALDTSDHAGTYIPDSGYAAEYVTSSPSRNWAGLLLISVGIGLAAAVIAILIMRSTMNTRKPQRSAQEYMMDGSFSLPVHQDIFLYSQVSKTPKPQNNTGSSTHRSSGGSVHSGRGGKF